MDISVPYILFELLLHCFLLVGSLSHSPLGPNPWIYQLIGLSKLDLLIHNLIPPSLLMFGRFSIFIWRPFLLPNFLKYLMWVFCRILFTVAWLLKNQNVYMSIILIILVYLFFMLIGEIHILFICIRLRW